MNQTDLKHTKITSQHQRIHRFLVEEPQDGSRPFVLRWQMDQRRAALQESLAMSQRQALPHPEDRFTDPAPEPHPLGKAKAGIVRHYWVPTIPGYSGYIPGKHAENIHGGGIIHTCQMAGRAIAERTPPPEPVVPVTDQELLRGRGEGDKVAGVRVDESITEYCWPYTDRHYRLWLYLQAIYRPSASIQGAFRVQKSSDRWCKARFSSLRGRLVEHFHAENLEDRTEGSWKPLNSA